MPNDQRLFQNTEVAGSKEQGAGSPLPVPFSPLPAPCSPQAWVAAWKSAGPNLQQIRDEELRQKGNKGVHLAGGVTVYETNPHLNGMVTMQAWFMRQQLLLSQREREARRSSSGEGAVA